MKIIDSFIFFNEIDILKIRLELLYDQVDQFVICEANITHSGNPKPYCYLEHIAEFSQWQDKIVHLKYEPDITNFDFEVKDTSLNPTSPPWKIENGQRNHLATFLLNLNEDDYCIVSDADEIWNPNLADYLRSGKVKYQAARLDMLFHYYYLNCRGIGRGNSIWKSAFYAKNSFLRANPDLTKIRTQYSLPSIGNAGWHFSYIGGFDNIVHKLESFAHQESNLEKYKSIEHLQKCLRIGVDFLERSDHEWAFHPIGYYPESLQKIMLKYPELIRSNLLES